MSFSYLDLFILYSSFVYLCLSVVFVFPGSCSYGYSPFSGFLSLSCKSGLCIFRYLCLMVCSVLSLYSLSQYQSYLVYCLWSIFVLVLYLRSDFLVSTLFPCLRQPTLLPFAFVTSAYRIIWITDLCLLVDSPSALPH